ncbi:MAG: hypothetical protein FWE30_05410, partial [Bacteroidales bacterium]|nr:hypothetical protein [Bacteroidales bacterium]
SAVSAGNNNIAYVGGLFFNPYASSPNQGASLFFPAPGFRIYDTGALTGSGGAHSIGFYASSSARNTTTIADVWHATVSGYQGGWAGTNYSSIANGFSIRCVYDPQTVLIVTPDFVELSHLPYTPSPQYLTVSIVGGGIPGSWTMSVPSGAQSWLSLTLNPNGNGASSFVNGSGSQPVYIVAARNMTNAQREAILTLNGDPSTRVLQEGYGGSADRITVEGAGNNAKLVITRDPRNAGVYFHFGSVTAIYSRPGGVQDLAMQQGDGLYTVNSGNISSWTAFYPGTYSFTTVATIPKYAFATDGHIQVVYDNAYHNLTNVQAGKGDPCRLIGMTAGEIRGFTSSTQLYAREIALMNEGIGGWRTPTSVESQATTQGNNTISGIPETPFWYLIQFPGTTEGNVPGVVFPNAANPNLGTFMPAIGYIAGTGRVNQQGYKNATGGGWYQLANRTSTTTTYYFDFARTTLYVDRAGAPGEMYGVRCIRWDGPQP